jgi:hypothetical protein
MVQEDAHVSVVYCAIHSCNQSLNNFVFPVYISCKNCSFEHMIKVITCTKLPCIPCISYKLHNLVRKWVSTCTNSYETFFFFFSKPSSSGKALKLGRKGTKDVESFVDQLESEGQSKF